MQGERAITFNIVIDQQRDLTLILAEGVPTFDDFQTFLAGPRNGMTAKAVWDFRCASLSNLNRDVLQDIAIVGRDASIRNGQPLAVALIATRIEDRLLLKLYNELSLHTARRSRPHRLFTTLTGAMDWLDRVVGQPGPDGTHGPLNIPDNSESFDPDDDDDLSGPDMAGLI